MPKWPHLSTSLLKTTTNELFPTLCCFCRHSITDTSATLCRDCKTGFIPHASPHCTLCGGTVDGALTICSECLKKEARNWDAGSSAYPYKGKVRALVHAYKYGHQTHLASFIANEMVNIYNRDLSHKDRPDTIVPIPLHPLKRLIRGFNQTKLVADFIGKSIDMPVRNYLRRSSYRLHQAQLDISARRNNVKSLFTSNTNKKLTDRHILLLDDVMTTGFTLMSATEVIRQMDAAQVTVLTFARG